jgi:hypothetical protein
MVKTCFFDKWHQSQIKVVEYRVLFGVPPFKMPLMAVKLPLNGHGIRIAATLYFFVIVVKEVKSLKYVQLLAPACVQVLTGSVALKFITPGVN